MVYATLHLRLSNGQQQSHTISQASILIGRGLANDLLINDASLAPTHARLTFQKGEVVIEDLGSISGTYISGVRLEAKKPYVLSRSTELIRFGNVDALVAPPNTAPPEWPPLAAPAQPVPEPAAEVQPPPPPKFISLRLSPRRSTRDFIVFVTRSADDPDPSLQTIVLAGSDPTEDLAFTFKPQVLKLEPGETRSAQLQVRGLPGVFTITVAGKGKSYTAATKGALVAPDRTFQIVALLALVLSCVAGTFALATCPTSFRAVCGFVPANPVSLAVSSATFTPLATLTATPTPTASPSPTSEPDSTLPPTATVEGAATLSPTLATQTPPEFAGGLFTYKRQQSNGQYSLMAISNDGSVVTLIANKIDIRPLDYSTAAGLLAVDVYDGLAHTLMLIKGDGTIVKDALNEGWDTIRNAEFAPDGSFLVVDTLTQGTAHYYFYTAEGAPLSDLIPLTPTPTPTLTRTPTKTLTPTLTRTPSNTATPSRTPTETKTATPSNTPVPSNTPAATNTPT